MILDYVRLALATAVVLLPGYLVARALGQRTVSAALGWGLAAIFVAWTVVFALHLSVKAALAVLLLVVLAASLAGRRRRGLSGSRRPNDLVVLQHKAWVEQMRGRALVLLAGVVLGILLWHVAGVVSGDGLFHLARVRKLVELSNLHLRSVDEFRDGGLHPGYAFPLWHGFLALVSSVSGLDPSLVVNHEASVLAPIACIVAWEAGVAVFGAAFAGVAVLAASLGLYCFAAGNGGAFASLALPGTASRQLLVPAAIALFFGFAESRRAVDAVALGTVFGALALVHPTYALFLLLPLGGYALVRPTEWRRSAVALGAALLPTALALLWLRPILAETRSRDPGPMELTRALAHYSSDLDVFSRTSYRLAPDVVARSGAVAVAALLLVPLAGLALRRRWGAFVLGGFLPLLLLLLVPALFTHFSDAVSLSQSRRAAGFVPFAFALVGGFALLARSRIMLPAALAAGIVLQLLWPGRFGPGAGDGGPALATWIALVGGAAALVAGIVFALRTRNRPCVTPTQGWSVERHSLGAAATALFVLPVAVHGFAHWRPRVPRDPQALSPGLVERLRDEVPARAVVLASPAVSYRILAVAPVYVVTAPVPHVANTDRNRPNERRRDYDRWAATHDPAIPRAYGATWVVERGRLRRFD